MAGVHVAWQGLVGSQTAPKLKTSTFFWFSYKMSKSRKFSSEAFLACLKNSIFEKTVISPSPQTKKLFFLQELHLHYSFCPKINTTQTNMKYKMTKIPFFFDEKDLYIDLSFV
jgi:hypothetical protein